MAGLCTLYDFTVHELDAVLAQAGLQIAVTPLTPEPAARGDFSPFDSVPVGEGTTTEVIA